MGVTPRWTVRLVLLRCLLVRCVLVLAIALAPVAVQAAPARSPAQPAVSRLSADRLSADRLSASTLSALVAPGQGPAAVEGALEAVEAELTLLLGRYASPLDVATLLGAGWGGVVEAARTAPGGPAPGGPAPDALASLGGSPGDTPFAPERESAWADFVSRFQDLTSRTEVAPGALAQAANRAMARSVGDCHTSYAASHEREVQSLDRSERYSGVGATVADAGGFDPRPPGPLIAQVVDGGPAQRAGVRAGDAVLAVDGEDIADLSPARLVERVRGPAGSMVALRLDRPGVAGPVEVLVERGSLDVSPAEGRLLGDGETQVGYVALREFSRAAEAALPATLEELRAAGATHWVLDLRGNRGGNLQTFLRLASLFIQSGTLAVTVDRSGAETTLRADGRGYRAYVQPLAVLVDRQSASAAELLAADLQEYGTARVFGTATAGCFGTSRLFRLPDGSALWLTVSALQSGLARRNVHGEGLTPDEVVTRTRADLVSGTDTPLDRALAWVTRDS
ncbi:MAG: S41 family peptidase [Chloroflexota bacterium]|nr:S41 family peptidase [Chloroflexota bacterium]